MFIGLLPPEVPLELLPPEDPLDADPEDPVEDPLEDDPEEPPEDPFELLPPDGLLLLVALESTVAFLPAADPEEEELLLVDEELPTLLMVTFCELPVLAAVRLPLVFSAAADIM
jgi:hypothetical protein